MITVALVDDQPLVRAGFSMLVNSQPDMEVVWQASDGTGVLGQSNADIVLLDIRMPGTDGITACSSLLEEQPHTRVIMLTTFDDRDLVLGALEAGASGFLLKDADPDELLEAIRTVHGGDAVLAPKVTKYVIGAAHAPEQQEAMRNETMLEQLTPREVEILRLVALGYSNEEIATAETLSPATVKTHVHRILFKTDSRDRVHAVLFAFRAGVVGTSELLGH